MLRHPAYVREAIQEIDDAHLWNSMDLDGAGLQYLRRSVRAGDFERAGIAWGVYWSAKKQPSYVTSMDHLLPDTDLLESTTDFRDEMLQSPDQRDTIIARAELIVQNTIRTWGDSVITFGKDVDFNRDMGQSGKYGFHYWIWSRPLLMASVLTGDEKYLKKFGQLFNVWYEQRNSITRGFPSLDVVYYELGLGIRNRMFIEYYLLPCRQRSAGSQVRLLKTFLAAGRWLYQLEKWEGYRPGNWQVHGAYMLVQLALVLPEFRESAQWRQIGLQRMMEHLEKDFFPDGGHSERSPRNYTMATYLNYRNLACLLAAYETEQEIATRLRASIGRTVEWWRSMLTPTGEIPAINDSHRGLFPERIMRDGKRFVSGGSDARPRYTSRHMPESGFTVMRSDWSRDASYMTVNYGPFAGFHTHLDLLDFELYAYGTPLAVDAGIGSTYDDSLYLTWYRSSRAHNMVVVNDSNIEREGLRGENIRWGSTATVDYFAGEQNGYRRFGVRHRRHIAFMKP
ncbi:MAG TPA: alginate lyase family protein, partial [Bacteroidota bacterium]|nr:alginate lyase family protein [Bacteroidota bacterium]